MRFMMQSRQASGVLAQYNDDDKFKILNCVQAAAPKQRRGSPLFIIRLQTSLLAELGNNIGLQDLIWVT